MEGVQRQEDKPLFPDIFWNRPTLKSRGGRLLVVGGHKHEFALIQGIYQLAEAAGAGYVQAAMPDTLRRLFPSADFGYFLPSTASGSLGRASLGELQHLAAENDGVILGANLTNNAETGILIESLLRQLENTVIITEETINILKFNPDLITGNPHAVVVTTMPGLFNLANNHHLPLAIRPNSGVIGKLEILRQLVEISRCRYLVFDREVMVAADGQLSLTPLAEPLSDQPAIPVALAAVMAIQNPSRPFQALTTAAYLSREIAKSQTQTLTQAASTIRQTIIANEQ
jgi:NAD(P)H-hydrate repair Nnr-like enzyme with NAD(P)H-hydrate dehydratase domain